MLMLILTAYVNLLKLVRNELYMSFSLAYLSERKIIIDNYGY